MPAGPHYLHRFATGRVVSVSITPHGGDAERLSLWKATAPMIRLLASAYVCALLLAACAPESPATDPAADPDVAAAGAEAAPAAPEGFELSTTRESETYTVTAEIDPAILAFDPPLAWRLWSNANQQLNELAASADEGRRMADEDTATTGEKSWFMGYTLDITHKATAVLDDVISVSDFVGTYTGGAHPNYFLGGAIYRKGEEAALPLSTFVTDPDAFNELVIKALVEEKIARGYEITESASVEASLRELLVPSAEIPDVYAHNLLLAASTEPGKAGGLTVVFSPYDIGSYAEGSYEVTIPAEALAPILTEAWSSRFGGLPVVEEDELAIEEQ